MSFKEEYAKLNPEQKQAVDTIDGPVMVIAGPGSGKTELLSLRVANILQKADVTPGNILCLTFTDAAVANMRRRLTTHIGPQASRVAVHTFHSFGKEIINRYPEHFYNGASFLPADDATQTEILEKIFAELDHDDPLRSEYKGKFTYLYSAGKAIEYLKKAGLTPEEFKTVLAENKKAIAHADPIIQSVFNDRVSKKMFGPAAAVVPQIADFKSKTLPGSFKPFTESLAHSLTQALSAAQQEDATGPLTEWKNKWTAKGEDKVTHLVDLLDMERMESLANIYAAYSARMHDEGYFDYNDMILDAIAMFERNVGVRLDLQERYLYILVDEFQDTNDAQMRLLRLLTDNPVHEGRPNLMVVGDDDQAIYKFQGAEISNILDFRTKYRDPAMVVLTENYRSTQDILNAARHIIKSGTARLENILPDLRKELNAANKKIKAGAIKSREFRSRDLEYHWLAAEVKKLLADGIPAKEIAIISRKHEQLESLVPYFHAARIPVAYERQQNVLEEAHILQLITMARFVDSIMKKRKDADDLLPEILSYPFWGIDRIAVWELSIKARSERIPWLAAMLRFGSPKLGEGGARLADIARFFIDLGGRAAYETAEEILHELIGGPQLVLPDENSEEENHVRHEMFSPFRTYYFGKTKFDGQRAEYLRFLSSLQAFIGALREYRRGQKLSTQDMLAFVDTHITNNLPINNNSSFVNAQDAVQLMTSHKAKGLEFEAVFVISCQESIWAKGNSRGSIPLPKNLPIAPAGDDLDDQLRLFFVAITRAKRLLHLTSFQTDAKGKDSARLGFLAPGEHTPEFFKPEMVELDDVGDTPEELLTRQLDAPHIGPFTPDENALLNPLIENYQLSVTHLQNFLNVADAGPAAFFEKNLLAFPEPKTASSALGSAVHGTIQQAYDHLKSQEKLPTTVQVLEWFEGLLEDERLNDSDHKLMLKRGQESLKAFYDARKKSFSAGDKVEFNFKDQGVVIGDASLAGKIDLITTNGSEMTVHDFKTGKVIKNWSPSDQYEKVKAWKYRLQLVFYKLLIENSRDFGGKYTVNRGVIDFVEPSRGQQVTLPTDIEPQEVERVTNLIQAVNKKIKSLDFPDISKYSKDLNGIKAFEEELLK